MNNFFTSLQAQTAPAQTQMLKAPIFDACARGEITLDMYVNFLTQAFHHVKHTVPLLMASGSRLSHDYEWVRNAIAEYIDEEKGHHEWILNDIEACGRDANAVRHNQSQGKVSASIELMVAYLYHQIDRGNPMSLFGMVWVLEGTSVGVGGKIAQLVKNRLQLPDQAMTYLVSHSELDQNHIRFFERLMNKVTDENDQKAIIDSANMVFSLYGQMLNDLYSTPAFKAA
jgi:pyrroloquinoline quinone (PQQ) biosynthesis protein C